jgi:hypothetical protein
MSPRLQINLAPNTIPNNNFWVWRLVLRLHQLWEEAVPNNLEIPATLMTPATLCPIVRWHKVSLAPLAFKEQIPDKSHPYQMPRRSKENEPNLTRMITSTDRFDSPLHFFMGTVKVFVSQVRYHTADRKNQFAEIGF